MATMNISLPDELREAVEREVSLRGYSNTSEYLRELIRRDVEAQPTMESLKAKIQEAFDSGPPTPLESDFFDKLQDRIRREWS